MSDTIHGARRSLGRRLSGHAWTIMPELLQRFRPQCVTACKRWSTDLEDAYVGTVTLTGDLREHPDARAVVVVVHGLGGSPASFYCQRAVAQLDALGYATLNLALRGADHAGRDYYHVAQTADLHAALASPELAKYPRIFILGFSMGGHVVLRLAADRHDPRVRAVAAICSPLQLEDAQQYLDARPRAVYRSHVLRGLKAIYASVATQREVCTPVEELQRARSIYEWDELAICPRYGFESPSECYAQLSVGPRLAELRVATLLVAAENDPVIPAELLRRSLPSACAQLDLRWARRGGHLSFARDLDLGCGPLRGLVGQVSSWFEAQAQRPLSASSSGLRR